MKFRLSINPPLSYRVFVLQLLYVEGLLSYIYYVLVSLWNGNVTMTFLRSFLIRMEDRK